MARLIEWLLQRVKRRSAGFRSSEEELDRSAEEEIARNLWANFRMLPPNSRFSKWWNRISVALVMYNCAMVPFILGYSRYDPNNANLYYYDGLLPGALNGAGSVNPFLLCLDYLIDAFFVADIAIVFRTTYFDEDNELD